MEREGQGRNFGAARDASKEQEWKGKQAAVTASRLAASQATAWPQVQRGPP